ncbi:ABC transporter permease [Mycoplasma sp. OR1901]|uniref:ABC transporter permease n=1 Tax=Mycoplasma sp. OR1901 TaxID=2742195 RepID=UPI001583C620|nr:hypothetical protein [Mycoplasma sp. OR1901]QKT05728.1 hypothetical protein HTZ87_03445 [Mycoplasma sp. OR1901]
MKPIIKFGLKTIFRYKSTIISTVMLVILQIIGAIIWLVQEKANANAAPFYQEASTSALYAQWMFGWIIIWFLFIAFLLIKNIFYMFQNEGMQYILQSKPISRKTLYFSNVLTSLIVTTILNVITTLVIVLISLISRAIVINEAITIGKMFLYPFYFFLTLTLLSFLIVSISAIVAQKMKQKGFIAVTAVPLLSIFFVLQTSSGIVTATTSHKMNAVNSSSAGSKKFNLASKYSNLVEQNGKSTNNYIKGYDTSYVAVTPSQEKDVDNVFDYNLNPNNFLPFLDLSLQFNNLFATFANEKRAQVSTLTKVDQSELFNENNLITTSDGKQYYILNKDYSFRNVQSNGATLGPSFNDGVKVENTLNYKDINALHAIKFISNSTENIVINPYIIVDYSGVDVTVFNIASDVKNYSEDKILASLKEYENNITQWSKENWTDRSTLSDFTNESLKHFATQLIDQIKAELSKIDFNKFANTQKEQKDLLTKLKNSTSVDEFINHMLKNNKKPEFTKPNFGDLESLIPSSLKDKIALLESKIIDVKFNNTSLETVDNLIKRSLVLLNNINTLQTSAFYLQKTNDLESVKNSIVVSSNNAMFTFVEKGAQTMYKVNNVDILPWYVTMILYLGISTSLLIAGYFLNKKKEFSV